MTFVLGIDIGTSGVRTAVLNASGHVISMARVTHLPQTQGVIDAQLWWVAVQNCVIEQVAALAELGHDPGDIIGIAIDGTSGSMVLTDADVMPVSPGLMYNSKCFTVEAAKIARHAPATHITQGSNSALARAMHLVAIAERPAAHLLHQADFIAAKFMGRGGMSDHNNALKTGFDPEREVWPNWISEVIDPQLLPSVVAVGTPMAKIAADIAQLFGVSQDVCIYAGTTDSVAAFLACAELRPGMAVTSLGSTLAVKLLSTHRIDDPEIGLYSHRIGDMWLTGGASNTGGAVIAKYFSPQEIERLSEHINPKTSTGYAYYPLTSPGERFPINDPDLQPRLSPRPADDAGFLKAIFEGIARIEAQCYAAMHARGATLPTQILSAGGGASNPVFREIRAQALAMMPSEQQDTEAAIGVAKLVLMNNISR